MSANTTANVDFNPFTEATAGQYFVGREEQLKQFSNYLKGLRGGNPNHIYIAGHNGTGKTSYLQRLVELSRAQGFMAAMPTLDENRGPYEYVNTIMRSIVRSIQGMASQADPVGGPRILEDWDRGPESKNFRYPRLKAVNPDSDLMREDFEKLEQYMGKEIPGAVVCIDEAQRIHPAALSALKNSLQHHSRYLLILSLRPLPSTQPVIQAGRALLEEKAQAAEGDQGAAAFFVTGIAMGPFDDDVEAANCIRRRLTNNVIQFDNSVAQRIGQIEGRIPRPMIKLASDVYNLAQTSGVSEVSLELVDEAFRRLHRIESNEAAKLVDSIPDSARKYLRVLIETKTGRTARDIADYLYPDSPSELLSTFSSAIEGELDRICDTSTTYSKVDDRYVIVDPARAYALSLLLRMK